MTVEYSIHSDGRTSIKLDEFALTEEQATYRYAYKLAQRVGLDRLTVTEYVNGRPKHSIHVVNNPTVAM